MTIKEFTTVAKGQQLKLCDLYGSTTPIDTESPLQLSAYGDFTIDTIRSTSNPDEIEITIKMQPVKGE